jgi:hypothetical protein
VSAVGGIHRDPTLSTTVREWDFRFLCKPSLPAGRLCTKSQSVKLELAGTFVVVISCGFAHRFSWNKQAIREITLNNTNKKPKVLQRFDRFLQGAIGLFVQSPLWPQAR